MTTVIGSRFVLPYQTVVDSDGVPIPGALLNFYASGTSTPLNTYSDAALTIANTNPVVADAAGVFPSIFMQQLPYKVILTDSLLNQIWTADPVYGRKTDTGTVTLTGVTPVTVTDANVTANSIIAFTLKTVGGTVGAYPSVKTITAGVGFTVAGTAADTSIYNYSIVG